MYKRAKLSSELPPWSERFGIRSRQQVLRDVSTVVRHLRPRDRYTFGLKSAGLIRPDLSLPAYAGLVPTDGISPIYNFFDRIRGGQDFTSTVRRNQLRDWRGGWLSYDEHDGTDFVCPTGTPVVAAAPGVVVAKRDTWLRGGLTLCVDHGQGVVTQYTHLSALQTELGQPVARGEIIALSGHSGFEMTQFFPWVPPHLHFMVWIEGKPVDPYLAEGEHPRAGTWLHRNQPVAVEGPLPNDPLPSTLANPAVEPRGLEAVMRECTDDIIRQEIERAPTDAARVAIIEDSMHHDRPAWAVHQPPLPLRPKGEPSAVQFTLPLHFRVYRSAKASDTRWTKPPRLQ